MSTIYARDGGPGVADHRARVRRIYTLRKVHYVE